MTPTERDPGRKTTTTSLAVPLQRRVLPNGLVALASPDPDSGRVIVDVAFRAGALYEPSDRSGLAHLVEHLMMRGPTPDSDYLAMLESKGATQTNAFTGAELMVFRTEVPTAALPLALWVAADRLQRLPGLLDEAALARERRVVEVERVLRHVDVPYGAVETEIVHRLFPAPHPLHGDGIGTPADLARVTLDEVRAFVAAHLTAANALVTVVGGFDPAELDRLVDETFGPLPSGVRAEPAGPPRGRWDGVSVVMAEQRSRRPRVSVVWRLDGLTRDVADALQVGAVMLSSYVDGAFGTEVDAHLEELDGWGSFRLDLTMPYDKPVESAAGEAEVFLRWLTAVDLPRELFDAGRLALDRGSLFALEGLASRAALLTHFELTRGDATLASKALLAHWRFARHDLQHTAWKTLVVGPPRLIVHARPTKPAQPKPEWEARP